MCICTHPPTFGHSYRPLYLLYLYLHLYLYGGPIRLTRHVAEEGGRTCRGGHLAYKHWYQA